VQTVKPTKEHVVAKRVKSTLTNNQDVPQQLMTTVVGSYVQIVDVDRIQSVSKTLVVVIIFVKLL